MKPFQILTFVLLSFAYVAIALYNGFPLVASDTGAYINNGYILHLPEDRTLTYSLFLRISSLSLSLWFPLLVQGGIIALLIHQLCKFIWQDQFTLNRFLLLSTTLIAFTNVSWYASQLMPDIFTAIMLLLLLLLYSKETRYQWLYWVGLVVCALMHNSNLLILLCTASALIIVSYIYLKNKVKTSWKALGVAIFSMVLLASLHAVSGNGFTLSKGSHVFMIAKLAENGVLKKYLDDNCQNSTYQLCAYKDKLPPYAWDFVWNADQPTHQMGGWEGTKSEYKAILGDLARSPKYYLLLLYKSIIDTARQLTQIYVGDGLSAHRENTNPFWKVQEHYGHELSWYMGSKQQNNLLDWAIFNWIYWAMVIISSLGVLLYWEKLKSEPLIVVCYLLVVVFLVSNAFVTANFANVLARLQSRIVWLLPMLNLVFLMQVWFVRSKVQQS